MMLVLSLVFMLASCSSSSDIGEYAKMLRPSVLKQLNPDVVRLVNEFPNVDMQNELIVGRLFAHGGLGRAEIGDDGAYHAVVSVEEGQFLWKPAIVVMPQGGQLELEFTNPDVLTHHAVLLPNNGNRMLISLPSLQDGRARLKLDGPGLYWFGCPVGNHAGRGMLGLILVGGEVPAEAKLDRPEQIRYTN